MRHFLTTSAILLAAPLWAAEIETTSRVTEVTLYPQGASVTREIALDIEEGEHELFVTGLPQDIDPHSLRIEAEGVRIGAVSLQEARALPPGRAPSPEIEAARAEMQRLERELQAHEARVDAIRAEALTSGDVIEMLRAMAGPEAATGGDGMGFVDAAEARIRAARAAMIEAETRAFAAEQEREAISLALGDARDRLYALQAPDQDHKTLVLGAESEGGAARIRLFSTTQAASWRPVYDLRLAQGEEGEQSALEVERGILAQQDTGEDWTNARLQFSTARPAERASSSELTPRIIRAEPPQMQPRDRRPGAAMDSFGGLAEQQAMPAPAPALARTAEPVMMGATLSYDYPLPVTIRSGADALRLSLDTLDLSADVVAEAVPLRDSRAYLIADLTNDSDEILLPGQATLYSDGALVGRTRIALTSPGDEMTLGFGAIDGIVLERRTPSRMEGERGFIRRSNSQTESAILSVRNLTERDWKLRLIDQVPVTEQETLNIDWTASIPPTETDPDDKRGLLVWERDLTEGEVLEITLDTTITWPEGQELHDQPRFVPQ